MGQKPTADKKDKIVNKKISLHISYKENSLKLKKVYREDK